MVDRTAAARNARLREKKRAEGLVPVTVLVPATRREALKAIAAKMRDDAKIDLILDGYAQGDAINNDRETGKMADRDRCPGYFTASPERLARIDEGNRWRQRFSDREKAEVPRPPPEQEPE